MAYWFAWAASGDFFPGRRSTASPERHQNPTQLVVEDMSQPTAADRPTPSSPASESGLTTTEAPFIERAQRNGELFIEQPYEMYSEENHETRRRLYERMADRWERYANARFLEGLERLSFDRGAVPRLEDVNRFLEPLTGFTARAVSGYIPAYHFFDSIAKREFPTTITIR